MIRIAILDDEKADLEKEEQITRQYFYNRQAESEIATYQSVEWFLLGLTEEQFDIYILDAEMPVKNGIEVAKEIRKLYPEPVIIYVTNHLNYAVEAYEVNTYRCNGVQREHNKKLNNGLPILHKVPPKRDYGRYFCIMAEKGGTSHGGLTEKLSPFFHAKKQEVNAYGR
ncbi:LytR/AlgR family response regulator transcription factor [Blautia wexlerae]|uniref:Stage 0 sporulation protein A homolog n=1 Tax=Blautia wexlerae TaxID=418240 RepID=A0A564WYW8_9FIRM|nr:response regulator [Blautia wexlerae]VUX67345.1 Sensory transduction protein LytR [Blautia wexlerae]